MALLLDSNLWIDLTRTRSAPALKKFIAPYVNNPQACLADPIVFEVLRNATPAEALQLTQHFQSMPLLTTPANLWNLGVQLGQSCRQTGLNLGAIDLLIAVIALHHRAQLITFDVDFQKLSHLVPLQVKLLIRPTP